MQLGLLFINQVLYIRKKQDLANCLDEKKLHTDSRFIIYIIS